MIIFGRSGGAELKLPLLALGHYVIFLCVGLLSQPPSLLIIIVQSLKLLSCRRVNQAKSMKVSSFYLNGITIP